MADITSTTKITITELEIINRSDENVEVMSGSSISEDPNDYSPKANGQAAQRMIIHAELEKTDGTTFQSGDEITIPTRAYAVTATRVNTVLTTNDWTDLSGSTGVIGQWHVGGALQSSAKTINIKLNSRANGQAVLSNVLMDLGTRGIACYGVGFDIVAKIEIAGTMFAYGIPARAKTAYHDSAWQSESSNNLATVGIRTGTDLYNDLIDSRGASGTKRKCVVEALYEESTSLGMYRTTFAHACPFSLTNAEGCFVVDYLTPNYTAGWTALTPNSGESLSAFKTRVMSTPMQYGFYPDTNGTRVVYYLGEIGTNTPEWSDYRDVDLPDIIADAMIEQGWYRDTDKTALENIYRKAIEDNTISGKRITGNHFALYVHYDTVLEDTEYPYAVTMTYDPGTSSETVKNFSGTIKLTGAFGSVVVRPFSCTVMKYDDETKTPLAGAKIKLQRSNNGSWTDYTQEVTTDSSGLINFENLGLGTYRVVETEAPEGYSLAHSPGYDSESGTVISETFVIASTDTEGAKIQMGNVQNIQEAMVVYKDITNGVTLKTDTFSGIGGEPMTYDTAPSIATYESQGYEVLSNNYVKGTLFDDDSSVTQVFTVVLKKVDDMINVDCSACEELREISPDFVSKGVTQTICTSLKNDTGLNPTLTTLHDDCEDLDTANDCLIGMMDGEIEKYEACDWQKYMHKFIPNLYHLLKAGICAMCGLWTNIHNLWKKINELDDITDRIDCLVDYMYKGASFSVGESPTEGSYVVAGKGVSFYLVDGAEDMKSDVWVSYIAGGLCSIGGSCYFFRNDFTDLKAVTNFDNGTAERTSRSRKGNEYWGVQGKSANGGDLIFEVRIKLSQYPQIKNFTGGFGMESLGGAFHFKTYAFRAGQYAYGQHGVCYSAGYPNAGQPLEPDYDGGHLVPEGWVYLQVRMSYIMRMSDREGVQYSPYCFMGIRMNQDKIEC